MSVRPTYLRRGEPSQVSHGSRPRGRSDPRIGRGVCLRSRVESDPRGPRKMTRQTEGKTHIVKERKEEVEKVRQGLWSKGSLSAGFRNWWCTLFVVGAVLSSS